VQTVEVAPAATARPNPGDRTILTLPHHPNSVIMSSVTSAGGVFGVVWLVVWLPIFTIGTILFWRRRTIQPIKARSPALVVVTDAILGLYTLALCLQRILVDSYPCLLNMWCGFVGTVVLLNVYLWRCWLLYFHFNLTAVRLRTESTRRLSGLDDRHSSSMMSNFFVKNRFLTSTSFLIKLTSIVFILLMIAPLYFSIEYFGPISEQTGDGCQFYGGSTTLAAYVGCYAALFLWFAFSLRAVHDNFAIKVELRLTGLIAFLAVIPWYIFNQYAKAANDVFPYSTLCILVAVVAAFVCSTLYPLYATYRNTSLTSTAGRLSVRGGTGTTITVSTPDSPTAVAFVPDRLHKILDAPGGSDAFMQFLTREFSVENLLFYQAVERFRAEVAREMAEKNANGNGNGHTNSPSAKDGAGGLALNSVQLEMDQPARPSQSTETNGNGNATATATATSPSSTSRLSSSNSPSATSMPAPLRSAYLLKLARALYSKFVVVGSSFQVNLPDPDVRACEAHLNWSSVQAAAGAASDADSSMQLYTPITPDSPSRAPRDSAMRQESVSVSMVALAESRQQSGVTSKHQPTGVSRSVLSSNSSDAWSAAEPPPLSPPLKHLGDVVPTLFDDCQSTIYRLMEKDSMLRFVRSDIYKQWYHHWKSEEHKAKVLDEMNLA